MGARFAFMRVVTMYQMWIAAAFHGRGEGRGDVPVDG